MESDDKYTVFFGFSLGILLSFFLNYIVHVFTSESLIHCGHGGDGDEEHEHRPKLATTQSVHFRTEHLEDPESSTGYNGNNDGHDGHDDHDHDHSGPLEHTTNAMENERTALLAKSVNRRISIRDLLSKEHRDSGPCCTGINKACIPTGEVKTIGNNTTATTNDNNEGQEQNNGTTNHIDNNISPSNSNISSYENDDYDMYDVDDKTYHPSQGIACVENDIGYDLENLDTYRKNYMMGRRNTIEYASSMRHSINPGPRSVRSQAVSRIGLDPQASNGHTHSHSVGYGHGHYGSAPAVPTTHTIDDELEFDHGHIHTHYDEELGISAHHHHVETPFSKLLSIGLQTCLVLTLHKFPEGLIIFYTNQSDTTKSLGLSIFISLLLHNFVEGFAMTLPFFTAFESKWKAVMITAVLGGGSQPLGALIGYFIYKHSDHSDQKPGDAPPGMNFLLSLTAGFLTVISLQMFQTAVSFSDTHHHHADDDEQELEQNHTMGTTCLKWSCAGVCLILLSGIFV